MRYQPGDVATVRELRARQGDATMIVHVPPSSPFYEAALEGFTRLNERILERTPDFPRLYDSGVGYRKEEVDTLRHADDVLCSGWGDCAHLSCWRAAELRVSGEDPEARPYVYRSGPKRFHAVVARGDGAIEDPSLVLGMRVSPERRARMPRRVGDAEMQDSTPRRFAACAPVARGVAACTGCGACAGAMRGDHTMRHRRMDQGQGPGASGLEEDQGPGRGAVGSIGTRRRLMEEDHPFPGPTDEPPFLLGDEAAFQAGQEDYVPDEGGDYGPDEGDQGPDQEEAPPQKAGGGPGGAARAVGRGLATAGRAAYQPLKWAGMPLYYGAKAAYAPMEVVGKGAKAAYKYTVDMPMRGAKKVLSWLLGVEQDPEYVSGDEDVFTSPVTEADVAASPPSQRVRFDTTEVEPGVWGGTVKIPIKNSGGKVVAMRTTPAPTEAAAAERMMNLAKRASTTPALLTVASPQALLTLAQVRGGAGGELMTKIQAAKRAVVENPFVQFSPQ